MFRPRFYVFTMILFNVHAEVIFKNFLATAFESNNVNTKLYKVGNFNDPCKTTRDCRNFGYVCRFNKTCECSNMYTPDDNKKTCLGGVNQKCIYDEHCIKGAFCMNQEKCKCKDSSPIVLENGLVCSGGRTGTYSNITLVLISALIIIIVVI